MDNAFPYSTDAPGLQKNFHPFMESPPRSYHERRKRALELDFPTYRDIDPLYIPPVLLPPHLKAKWRADPDMNTPRISDNVYSSTEYNTNYQLTAPKIQGYSTANREGYYMSVYGRAERTTLNFPYILQVYTPKPFEDKFQTKESALTRAPQSGQWQIVNVFTGEHVYAPCKKNSHSYRCD